MLNKGLLKIDMRSTSMVLGILAVLFFLQYPLRALLELDWLRTVAEEPSYNQQMFNSQYGYFIEDLFGASVFSVFVIAAVLIIAGMLIGLERNTRRHDFNLSLPFSRKEIFLTKATLGVGMITLLFWLNVALALIIIQFSEFSQTLSQLNVLEMMIVPWLSLLAIYMFTLFMGTISGEMISQIVLSIIFLVFPYGFTMLVGIALTVHMGNVGRVWIGMDEFILAFTIPFHLFNVYHAFDHMAILYIMVSLAMFVLSLVLGTFLYGKGKSEKNGEFLLFQPLQPVFLIGIVACFGMFGGTIFTVFIVSTGAAILFYWFGFLVVGGIAFLITRRLLQMNVTLKTNR
ncbi:hypothetical protein DH09_13275 [Bacillaceae bacterium JMAK1]|nr:hypothetical protein DH09_13275 [Bacillaceae bacterium JMAK1]